MLVLVTVDRPSSCGTRHDERDVWHRLRRQLRCQEWKAAHLALQSTGQDTILVPHIVSLASFSQLSNTWTLQVYHSFLHHTQSAPTEVDSMVNRWICAESFSPHSLCPGFILTTVDNTKLLTESLVSNNTYNSMMRQYDAMDRDILRNSGSLLFCKLFCFVS